MDIPSIISVNLTRWMADSPDLNTDKRVGAKSGVGSSTVQRARTGNANVTVKSLERIAAAFKRSASDLLVEAPAHVVCEKIIGQYLVERDHPVVVEITSLARGLDDIGKGMLLREARSIAKERASPPQREAG